MSVISIMYINYNVAFRHLDHALSTYIQIIFLSTFPALKLWMQFKPLEKIDQHMLENPKQMTPLSHP